MAEYFYIQNYANRGKLALSHAVFDDIVEMVISQIDGVCVNKKKKGIFSSHKPVHCEIKNGKVTSFIEIKVAPNLDEEKKAALIKKIQDEVSAQISIMTELVPFVPVVKIVGVNPNLKSL